MAEDTRVEKILRGLALASEPLSIDGCVYCGAETRHASDVGHYADHRRDCPWLAAIGYLGMLPDDARDAMRPVEAEPEADAADLLRRWVAAGYVVIRGDAAWFGGSEAVPLEKPDVALLTAVVDA